MAALVPTAKADAPVRVIDGDTVDVGGTRYRISGIDAPESAQVCQDARGRDWRCGMQATAALERLLNGQRVTCRKIEPDGNRWIGHCTAGGRDVAAAMVERGWAWAFVRYSRTYVTQEAQARRKRLGIWGGTAKPAWDYRRSDWQAAANWVPQAAPEGCPIKANIGRGGERIYHAPWSASYERTRINPARGERWFCSEAEARAAGWRAPIAR
ncbi:MAG: thermonuclease family protein [Pseudomonadota bacterium]